MGMGQQGDLVSLVTSSTSSLLSFLWEYTTEFPAEMSVVGFLCFDFERCHHMVWALEVDEMVRRSISYFLHQ